MKNNSPERQMHLHGLCTPMLEASIYIHRKTAHGSTLTDEKSVWESSNLGHIQSFKSTNMCKKTPHPDRSQGDVRHVTGLWHVCAHLQALTGTVRAETFHTLFTLGKKELRTNQTINQRKQKAG